MAAHDFSLHSYNSGYLAALADFFTNYLNKYPDAKLNTPEFYTLHPALQDEENIFCVLDSCSRIVGFSPLFPSRTADVGAAPPDFWTIVLAAPDLEAGQEVRELLYNRIVERVHRLKTIYGLARVRLAADMMVSQKADIEFLLQEGFEPFEQVYVMGRDTSKAEPAISVPFGITFRQSRLESEDEQAGYLRIFNVCFPEMPKTLSALQLLLQSPYWRKGRVISACAPSKEPIGSILVYWDEQRDYGVTDDVMVLPGWRGRNIAKALIGQGVSYFRAEGIQRVRLEVKESNAAAVAVYASAGYSIINRECLLGKVI